MSELHAKLYRMSTDDHVCPYGLKSRDLLKRKGYAVEDHPLESRAATDAFKAAHQVETTPQTFIDGQRIGGYAELLTYFGLNNSKGENGTTYQPVIALFGLAALMTGAWAWALAAPLLSLTALKWFAAFSMCLLALQKLQDLEAFSLQFLPYDLLSARWVRYAYLYPFAEAFAGLGMLADFPVWLVAAPALFIGTEGAASVIKAVYIDKRDLKCACVGGDSKVPLGFVSLTENLMMIIVPLLMLWLS